MSTPHVPATESPRVGLRGNKKSRLPPICTARTDEVTDLASPISATAKTTTTTTTALRPDVTSFSSPLNNTTRSVNATTPHQFTSNNSDTSDDGAVQTPQKRHAEMKPSKPREASHRHHHHHHHHHNHKGRREHGQYSSDSSSTRSNNSEERRGDATLRERSDTPKHQHSTPYAQPHNTASSNSNNDNSSMNGSVLKFNSPERSKSSARRSLPGSPPATHYYYPTSPSMNASKSDREVNRPPPIQQQQLCAFPLFPGADSSFNSATSLSSNGTTPVLAARSMLTNPRMGTVQMPPLPAVLGQQKNTQQFHQRSRSVDGEDTESVSELVSEVEVERPFSTPPPTPLPLSRPPPPPQQQQQQQQRIADASAVEYLRAFLAERKGLSRHTRSRSHNSTTNSNSNSNDSGEVTENHHSTHKSVPSSAFLYGTSHAHSASTTATSHTNTNSDDDTNEADDPERSPVDFAVEPYARLTPDEVQELLIVLQDLGAFMSAEHASPSSCDDPFHHTTSTNYFCSPPTQPMTAQPSTDDVDACEAGADVHVGWRNTSRDSDRHATAAKSAWVSFGEEVEDQERDAAPPMKLAPMRNATTVMWAGTAITPVTTPLTTNITVPATPPHNTTHLRSDEDEEDLPSTLRKQSVEDRYKTTLASLESVAGDCQLALRRVEHLSASLYTLVETWMHLHDNRFDEFAHAVLRRLLDNNPSYQVLFYHTDLDKQAETIMDMIGRTVVGFTHPADCMNIMAEIGARHNLYGLQESHFIAMRKAFLEVYFEFVGPENYKKSVGSWKLFWKTTIELAVSGSLSERGEVYTQRRYVVWAERVKSIFKILIPRQRSAGFHRLMQKAYKRAVALYPNLQSIQQLGDLRTAHRTMEALIRITNSVTDGSAPPTSTEYNDQFSIQSFFTKSTIAFTADMMKQLEDPFLDACESYLTATGTWNIVVRAALQELWSNYITGYWIAQPEQVKFGNAQSSAPDGKEPFCLMFTDIEASTRLWDSDAQSMSSAVITHHKLIRGLIEDFGGYEVKTVGDSFLIATHTVAQALLIAFGIQLELMTGPSAAGFHMVDNTQGGGDASCWRDDALRVRVGIHYCTDASAVYDSVHNRFDYYGPSVNCAARIEAAACGGQVLLSQEALTKLKTEDVYTTLPVNNLFSEQLGKLVEMQEERGYETQHPVLAYFAEVLKRDARGQELVIEADKKSLGGVPTMASLTHVEDVGCHALKGIAEPVQLYSMLPAGLEGRVFHLPDLSRSTTSRATLFVSSPLMASTTTRSSATDAGLVELLDTSSAASFCRQPSSTYGKTLSFTMRSESRKLGSPTEEEK